ncbi:hypothetical protein NA57DRAFT_52542 [Rhizodiscina lignyota]|uniref:Mediator of RNA polymerase II transcription subunit 8 n=1 Tax=Rhizodiscina lignyota TaxID=1504668 RepID=A0A9P4IPH2_9PEZI|nr:hypothetical protein NA57DRAFT_52542 [Rhizodiscina lignyota]
MATESSLPPELKTLNTLRQRLMTITAALYSLRNEIQNPYIVLPPWDRVVKLVADLGQMTKILQDFQNNEQAFRNDDLGISPFNVPAFLNSAVVHPTTEFPATQENILGTLLTKKLAPAIEDWVEEGIKVAKSNEETDDAEHKEQILTSEQFKELWYWAVLQASDVGNKITIGEGDEYGDEDESSDDSDEEMVDAVAGEGPPKEATLEQGKAMIPLNDILKFISTGSIR